MQMPCCVAWKYFNLWLWLEECMSAWQKHHPSCAKIWNSFHPTLLLFLSFIGGRSSTPSFPVTLHRCFSQKRSCASNPILVSAFWKTWINTTSLLGSNKYRKHSWPFFHLCLTQTPSHIIRFCSIKIFLWNIQLFMVIHLWTFYINHKLWEKYPFFKPGIFFK